MGDIAICDNGLAHLPASALGMQALTDNVVMGERKPPRDDWNTLTRVELLAELARLQAENARLAALLPSPVRSQDKPIRIAACEPSAAARNPDMPMLSPPQKVQLFRRLFRGRTDVYPLRWESRTSGKSG
ncbi:hypothetical protein DIE15_13870 [Burkholderia sp. Bp9031]|uniref:TOTE conflict system archaeo-eukaryotic primase domain-containing protein n=1 Tax=Burkholderia sp. Bp9031 TaxID=2184566 RepID=UPI000F5F7C7A|nr:hypothetical protein [Burkholderia sp. Bp9031]RQZ16800.1 hypothetical protein DIE15_13870 [Burkholderia sp. Bp9031]